MMPAPALTDAEVRAIRDMLNERPMGKNTPITTTFCGMTAQEVIDMQKENRCMRAVIAYMLSGAHHTDECAMGFLRAWDVGDFDDIRKWWPDAPDAVFAGADPTFDAENPKAVPKVTPSLGAAI
jgi:hypothetical protein